MSRLLLNLRNVPEDEIEDVRELMAAHGIECYDTPPGPLGITAGGIWLRHANDYARARELMDDYQAQRRVRARSEWQAAQAQGRADTLLSAIRRHPLKALLVIAGSVFILMVLFAPVVVFFRAGG